LAERYKKKLSDLSKYVELPFEDNISTHAWHLFIIKLNLSKLKITRNKFIAELEKQGIGCGVHFIPIYHFTYYKKNFRFNIKNFVNCEKSFRRVISLPFYPDLTYVELDYVCDVITKLIRKFGK
ncbi:MAG: UDP-4-amino-4,6-dideoxy-N-acetyl-beta-L-altrosamine transaminase, partial [candidate division Zixibacteria bacterium]|nr:UDP-4-amino-4,6-dideoxy-N-acetyl-beta-L-altrosamine transaminase [candidate division Zixibacteria bacterium]